MQDVEEPAEAEGAEKPFYGSPFGQLQRAKTGETVSPVGSSLDEVK